MKRLTCFLLELTYFDGRSVGIPSDRIALIEELKRPQKSGSMIYFDKASGLDAIAVRESIAAIANALNLFFITPEGRRDDHG